MATKNSRQKADFKPQMLALFKKKEGKLDPALLFILRLGLGYASWKLISWAMHQWPLTDAWRSNFNDWLGSLLVIGLGLVAAWFGEKYHAISNVIYVEGTPGLLIADHCLAIPATVIFALLVWFFPGPLKAKVWFLPTGILLVQGINFLRLVGLMFMQKYSENAFFAFNHSVTYVFFTYGLIFLMLYWWINRMAPQALAPTNPDQLNQE